MVASPYRFSGAAVSVAGDCAELAARYDWSGSELGPLKDWAPSVAAVVRTLLEATVPMAYCHGAGHVMVYNDRFARVLGPRHPAAWGERAAVVVPEIWSRPGMDEVFDKVFAGGPSFHDDGDMLRLDGRQHLGKDEGYFVGSYSAVRDGDGSVLGVLVVAVEIPSAVRRIETVIELATALASAVTVDDVAGVAMRHAVGALGCELASVCVGGGGPGGWTVASWRRVEPWDDTSRMPFIWSGPHESTGSPEEKVAESGRRSVSENGRDVILPIMGPGLVGSVGFRGMSPDLPDAHLVVLEACALLVGDSMVRARQNEARRGAAELLQRTLLPQVLPSVPGVTLVGRYQPVSTGTAAGGDFYDAFSLPDGRLALAVGDVVGRGSAAATVMGQVRAGLRGAALANPDPNAVFTALDALVSSLDVTWPAVAVDGQTSAYAGIAGFGGELFVTALIGILNPATGELLLASAGHFPPAIVRGGVQARGLGAAAASGHGAGEANCPDAAGGSSHWAARSAHFADVQPGPPLGIPGDRPVVRVVLEEGDAVVAFTDGLLESHERSLSRGLEALLETLTSMTSTEPRTISQRLVDELTPEGLEDDCALLVLLRDSRIHHEASILVPPQAGAVRGARLWLRDQLESWGVDEEVAAAAVMGVSELVTNVVLHAGTPARVSVELGDRLLVMVEDTGARGAPHRQAGEDLAAFRGRGLGLVDAISDAMGHERSAGGSTVWFEIGLDRTSR